MFEPDNPANTWMRPDAAMTPNVHRQWGPLLDAGDCSGGTVKRATGPSGSDAEGTFDHDPVWEQVGPYALDARNASVAATDIVGGQSAVTAAMDTATRTALRTNVQSLEFAWEEPPGTARTVRFNVYSARRLAGPPDCIQLLLYANDVTPEFEPNDGSIDAAYKSQISYYPQGRVEGGAWHAGGYRIPSAAKVTVHSAEASPYVSGTSPGLNAKGSDGKVIKGSNGKPADYFGGRTTVFTQHRKLYDPNATPPGPRAGSGDKLLSIIIHELAHAFGNPHKCGNFDFLVPRTKTCCMNYYNTWVTAPDHALIAGFDNIMGFELCGRHIGSIRRTHLEDNPALGWK